MWFNKIRSSRYPFISFIGCIFLSMAVCYSQMLGNQLFILSCLIMFLLFCLWACDCSMIFSVLLYFLPWSPLLKLQSGGVSFFTIALLLACAFFFLKGGLSFNIAQLFLTMLIVLFTLFAKLIQENSVENSYLFFSLMLLLYPNAVKNKNFSSTFRSVTLFFAFGIITAALSAQQAADYSNILQYIKVDSYLDIVRRSGYYGDPNFYCAQITACLAGVQLMLSREKERAKQALLLIIMIVLIYCGLLSASKSFILVTALLFAAWIPIIFERGNRRFGLLIGIIGIVIIVFTSPVFSDLLAIVDNRFSLVTNVSDLTTGRTDLWQNYQNYFSQHPLLSLFGEGYTDVVLDGRASHNTIIQGIYQFGFLGFPLVLAWVGVTLKNIYKIQLKTSINWKVVTLMCIGVAVPWLGLDILFFDEFFLLPIYIHLAVMEYPKNSI